MTEHPSEEFYVYPDNALTLTSIAGEKALTKEDMGRTFKISMRICDTASRYVCLRLSNATLMENSVVDYHRQLRNIFTRAGEWIDVEIDYTVYEFMYRGSESINKNISFTAYGFGTMDKPIYLADVKTVEKLSDVAIGEKIFIFCEQEAKDTFAAGQCDIVCKKSPWVK